MTLTKAELSKIIYERSGIGRREAQELVEVFFELILTSLANGEDVKLPNFGKFVIKNKAERPGRNPKTGELIPIKARRVVVFHASPKFKEQLANATART